MYQVIMDGVTSPSMSGAADPEEFNALLYSATVPKGTHNVTVVNAEDKFLDIDSVSSPDTHLYLMTEWELPLC